MSRALIEVALNNVKKKFVDVFTSKVAKNGSEYDLVLYRAQQLFDYTVIGGKYGRSSLCLSACSALQPGLQEDSLEMRALAQCAATLELIQSFYLIADDIMDDSKTRRGKDCWYRMPGIGMSAINDAFMMDSAVEDVLRTTIPGHPNLDRLCEAYRKSKQKTLLGQLLDMTSCGKLESFNWDRYESIVENKTSHYTIFHPIQQALLLSDVLGYHGDVKKIAYQIGFLFQSQDDVLDVFGDPKTTGKVGTDIIDGKCTWLTVRALQKIQKAQDKSLFDELKSKFGQKEHEKFVKDLFTEMKLKEEFALFEKNFSNNILKMVSKLPTEISPLQDVLATLTKNLIDRKQ